MPIINTRKLPQPYYRSLYKMLINENLEVPNIQRSYAWEKEQIDDFFEEISLFISTEKIGLMDDSEINLAMGQSIFYSPDNKTTFIYDGQQRIITYTLFAKALSVKYLKLLTSDLFNNNKLYEKRIKDLKLVYTKTLENGEEEPRVTVQKNDRAIYERILGFPSSNQKNNSMIEHAYKIIEKYINERIDNDQIEDFFNILYNKIEMQILKVSDDDEAEAMFYTTNSIGKPLSVSQLLHARIHQVLTKYNKNTVKRWDAIYENFSKRSKADQIDSYILYSVQVDNFTITVGQVFNHINNKLKASQGNRYIEILISRLEILYNFMYEKHSEYNYMNEIIGMTAIKQIYPLFIALSEKEFAKTEVAKKCIEVLIFIILQNNVIRQSPGTTKHALGEILKNINDNKLNIFEGIQKEKNVYDRLTDLSVEYDNKSGKVLLALLILKYNESSTSLIIQNKDTELEHIVPQDNSKWIASSIDWKNEFDINKTRLIYSLGNFILLSGKVNKKNSNNVWVDKKGHLVTNSNTNMLSGIINDNLINVIDITPEYIIERTRLIADKLVHKVFKPYIE